MPSIRPSLKRRMKTGETWGLMKCLRIYHQYGPDDVPVMMLDLSCSGHKTAPSKCGGFIQIPLKDFPGKVLMPDCGCGESGMVIHGLGDHDETWGVRLNLTWGVRLDGVLRSGIDDWKYHKGSNTTKAEVMRELLQYGLASKVKTLTMDLRLIGTERYQVGVIVDDILGGLIIRWGEKHGLGRSQAVIALMKLGLKRFGLLGVSHRERLNAG